MRYDFYVGGFRLFRPENDIIRRPEKFNTRFILDIEKQKTAAEIGCFCRNFAE